MAGDVYPEEVHSDAITHRVFPVSAGGHEYELRIEDTHNSRENHMSEYSLMWGADTDLSAFEEIVASTPFDYERREELYSLDEEGDRRFQVAYSIPGGHEVRWVDGHATAPYSIIFSSEGDGVEPLEEYFDETVAEELTDSELASFFDDVEQILATHMYA